MWSSDIYFMARCILLEVLVRVLCPQADATATWRYYCTVSLLLPSTPLALIIEVALFAYFGKLRKNVSICLRRNSYFCVFIKLY